MNTSLFENLPDREALPQDLGSGITVLKGFALRDGAALVAALFAVAKKSPFRHMVTPGGYRMSVAMTNCGPFGWVSDNKGYRYDSFDPATKTRWPAMPEVFTQLAVESARRSDFSDFVPDACLVNRYEAGARLALHQDKNERDFTAPIVSVSLGLPADFQFGGLARTDRTTRLRVVHGDVLVWGGPARLRYHGVLPLKPGLHALTGKYRFNLTFRKSAST
jgi:alkylated DNA repair protein (DNA oxidative demethylase)